MANTGLIRSALPELKTAYDQLAAYAKTVGIGIDVADFGGVRTLADTNQILQYRVDDFNAAKQAGRIRPDTTLQQFRPIAPFGSSYHNYGAAFDVMVVSRPASLSVYDAQKKLGQYAPKIGLRWGGTFTNPDTPHFELAISLADAQRRYREFAATGSANTPSVFDFDLSGFLPGLTPSNDTAPTLDVPDVYGPAGDDSGVAYLTPEEDAHTGMIVLGIVVAGTVLWALRRKFFA